MDARQMMNSDSPGNIPGLDIRIGDSTSPIQCAACKRISPSGLFVVLGGKATLVCIKCLAQGLVAWQERHPFEKLFDQDVNVPDEAYAKMAKRLQEIIPGVSDSDAVRACREVLDEI